MAEPSNTTDTNPVTYKFRFGTSDKLVHLTEKQLHSIRYLSALIAHKDHFLSVENENGEYVLNYPIEYRWFMPILCSIISKQAHTLFNELAEDENLLDVLQLSDYLCVEPFPLPHLRYQNLLRSNPVNIENENQRVKYYKANLSEARQTAAEFLIALARNQYKLSDSNTRKDIFTLINIILFNPAVFNSRFRHHTLRVA
ncbi:unnamed protein product, partial [Rotaria sordida]